MDILYYSNYCKHSQKVVQTLVKNNLGEKVSFVCIDKRTRDPNTGQNQIILENGSKVVMPPNVHSVPPMLLVNKNYSVILGDDILKHFHADMKTMNASQTQKAMEPSGYRIATATGGSNIMSEKFTDYNMSPDELSAKSNSNTRPLYNYVSASNDTNFINTPPDDYKPDKVSTNVTVDSLQQQRMDEIGSKPSRNPLLGI